MQIPLAQPDITEREIEAVVDVMRSARLSIGPKQAAFEQAVCDAIGCRHACAVSSGTAALHVGLIGCDVGPGDEVITSSFSFISSANCALFVGARPVLVDIDAETWNLDSDAIEAAVTPKTRAIVPVHVFGQPCRMDRIMAVAERHHLAVVEDSCEALGATFRGRKVGTFGNCGTFAFYPNKQITTGEGGMLITDDDTLADLARALRNQGRPVQSSWLEHEMLGYNYRMSELQAAVGEVQMQRLNDILARRAQVAGWYTERLAGYEKIRLQKVIDDVEVSWFVFVVRLADEYTQDHRDELLKKLNEHGIGCNAYFMPIHLQTFYRETQGYREGQLPVTETVGARSLAVPFFPRMTESQVDQVCDTLRTLIDRL